MQTNPAVEQNKTLKVELFNIWYAFSEIRAMEQSLPVFYDQKLTKVSLISLYFSLHDVAAY